MEVEDMTESEWLQCADPGPMVEFVRVHAQAARLKAGRRRLRLFAAACGRRAAHLLPHPAVQHALDLGERFADGLAHKAELQLAMASLRGLILGLFREGDATRAAVAQAVDMAI